MLRYVLSCLIYNSQKLERTQMSLNRGMDTETVVHMHNSAIKNNEFMKFLGKWMEIGTTTLEISLAVPPKTEHLTTRRSCYTTPGHIPRGFPTM